MTTSQSRLHPVVSLVNCERRIRKRVSIGKIGPVRNSFRCSEVLGLYLKRPPSEELGFETLCKGASDTAT